MRRITVGIGLLALAGATACDTDDGTGVEQEEIFAVTLTGAEEVPPVETDATGRAEFGWDGTTVLYGIIADSEITGVTAAHIHEGVAGENGDILVTLYSGPPVDLAANDFLIQGEFTTIDEGVSLTIDDLLDLMRSGGAYLNVHTETNPDGEIRGQISPAQD